MEKREFRRQSFIISFILMLVMVFSSFTSTAFAVDGAGTKENPFSVEQAVKNQKNSVKYVTGYIVGQPTAANKVLKKANGDTAIAIADNALETSTSRMIYVQLPAKYRDSFGLKTNPKLIGKKITVSGNLTAYFSHAGIKNTEFLSDASNTGTDDNGDKDKDDDKDDSGNTETTTVYDDNYYKNAMNKDGDILKYALHNIIKGHTKLSYSQVWDAIKDTDEDPNNSNNVILLYTGRSQAKSAKGSGVNDWNREHVWAKSHGNFGTAAGPGTDLHHLRATDVSVNSCRGNLDFDNGGSTHSEATQCRYDSDSWEPRDEVKGDIARMLFYMAVRYEGDNGEVDLELNDKVNNGTAPYMGRLSILLKWNEQDPVDETERRRNDIIFNKYQHNRNPFIDHPEWANAIWG
ncbi:MAG: endonuclease [Clostridium sp.]|uniref:endonuclease n=1 Tax=Clostridium sp. DSM 8431 TaxID=1761781 RepID=UPI0008ECCF5F|nr:endonuclease [Clostridium sp. DSM 8431]MCR4943759.1 endonuclease [Clostridium sp.]SFU87079.1 Endonuclease I [Clostridium sp. DSM 8431]